MSHFGLASRLFSPLYFGTAAASMVWILLQGDWTWVSAGVSVLLAGYIGLTIAATMFFIDRPEVCSSPDLQLTLGAQKWLRLVALAAPLPFIALSTFYWHSYLSLDATDSSKSQAYLCVSIAENFFGRPCAEELASQLAMRSCQKAEDAEIHNCLAAAESLYRLQSNYQLLAGRDTGPMAQAGIVAAAAVCDKQGKSHAADLLYTVAEARINCRYKDKDRSLSVIYGPHLKKLLKNVPDGKLPPSWYLTDTMRDLRHATAAEAALTWCAYDFIVEHDVSDRNFTPKMASLRMAQDAWQSKHSLERRASKQSLINIEESSKTSGNSTPRLIAGVYQDSREFSTKSLQRYLRRIKPSVAAENLAFYGEFAKYSGHDIDASILPEKRVCSTGFPYSARQLASHQVWRISERDYIALMTLTHDTPLPQFMCIDNNGSSRSRTY